MIIESVQYFDNWHQAVDTLAETKWSVIDIRFDWWCGRWKSLRFVAHEFNNDLHKCHKSPWIAASRWPAQHASIRAFIRFYFGNDLLNCKCWHLSWELLLPAKCRYWYILSSKQLIRSKFNCEVVSFSLKMIIVMDERNECYLLHRCNWHKSGLKSGERERH